ncbi:hypothetical protein BV898_07034 [Hypsibius exemplaris]|uniref:WAP domain-containing protein n=1 Tax=Hypsibius exemplaris TaxID=2072580 RepID=A0A1W0WUU1_HYPEX|nr:hypothetical protein BV898_07034 [Hypsibius exemplaris]
MPSILWTTIVFATVYLTFNAVSTDGASRPASTTGRPQHTGKSGLCPRPDCQMGVNCAPAYDCCLLGGSRFCVPLDRITSRCPAEVKCKTDYDCQPEEDKCCPARNGKLVCTHAVFV